MGRSWGGLGRSWSLLAALFCCEGFVGDRRLRPSEPREARRAKAEALMIMYFRVLNCLRLLRWFGDVLSSLGSMLLCSFALESFSRCCRSTTGLLRRTHSLQSAMGLLCRTHSALSVFSCSGFEPRGGLIFIDFPCVFFQCFLMFSYVRSLLVVLGVLRRSWGGLRSPLGRLEAVLGRSWAALGFKHI